VEELENLRKEVAIKHVFKNSNDVNPSQCIVTNILEAGNEDQEAIKHFLKLKAARKLIHVQRVYYIVIFRKQKSKVAQRKAFSRS